MSRCCPTRPTSASSARSPSPSGGGQGAGSLKDFLVLRRILGVVATASPPGRARDRGRLVYVLLTGSGSSSRAFLCHALSLRGRHRPGPRGEPDERPHAALG